MGTILHSELDKAIEMINDPTVDLSATNKDGVSALMFCFGKREYEIAELLMKKGANVLAQNKDGVSALLLALTTVKDAALREKMVSMLVERGADVVELAKTNRKAKEYLDARVAAETGAVDDAVDDAVDRDTTPGGGGEEEL